MILFRNFVLFVFTFFPFSDKRGLGDRPFRLLRPQGPRFLGKTLILLVSKNAVAVWVWAFCDLTNLFP